MFDRNTGLPNEMLLRIFNFFPKTELSKSLSHVSTLFNEIAKEATQTPTKNYIKQDATLSLLATDKYRNQIFYAFLTNYGTKLFLVRKASIDIIDLTSHEPTHLSRPSETACVISETEILTGINNTIIKWDTTNNTHSEFVLPPSHKGNIKNLMRWNENEIIIVSAPCALAASIYKFNFTTEKISFIDEGYYGGYFDLHRASAQEIYLIGNLNHLLINISNYSVKIINDFYSNQKKLKIPNSNYFIDFDCHVSLFKMENSQQTSIAWKSLYNTKYGFPKYISLPIMITENKFAYCINNTLNIIQININDKDPIQLISKLNLFETHEEYITSFKLLPNKTQLAICTNLNRFLIHDLETKMTHELINPDKEIQFPNSIMKNKNIIILNDENIIYIATDNCYKMSFPLKNELHHETRLTNNGR